MDNYQIIGLISQIVTATSVVPYVLGIIRGVIVPNRITWGIWMAVGIALWKTTTANPLSDEISIMFATILAINPTLIFILTIWKGCSESVKKMEMLAALIAIIALASWWYTKDTPGLFPTFLAILADVCALVPTIRFVLHSPDQDRPAAWACFTAGSFIALAGIQQWNIESVVLPCYMAIGSLFVLIPLVTYRIKKQVPLRDWI